WLDIAKVNLQTMVKKNFIILDFQWYRFNSDIILPKELASCDSDFKRSHFVFRPVFSFGALTIADQHVANYAFYKHHGLKWTEGYTPLIVTLNEVISCSDRGLSFGALTIADQHVANYAFYKHHGLKWTEGYTPLSEFDDIVRKLCADAEVVCVKGKEKKEFLSRILDKRIVDVENQHQNEDVAALAKAGKDVCGQNVCGQLQTPPDLPRSMPDLYYDIAGINFTPQDGPNVDNVRNDQLLWEDNCLSPQQLETTTATLHTIPQLAPVITPHQRDRTCVWATTNAARSAAEYARPLLRYRGH
ncbi:hypothetical protein QE152_g40957, partial [Popillia japonica]